ncbi:MAG: acyltransferase family protein [Candidatus Limnocylindrales bacterium]
MKFRPELDGLRAVAVLTVMAAHARVPGFASEGGLAGVTLFFVLSGYLITALLLAERTNTGRVDLRSFYIRRGLRLFPAVVALLIVVAVGSAFGLWVSAGGDMVLAIPAVLLYVGNWAQVAGLSMGPLGHTWSLAIEEQFYLIWPAALLLALRFGDRRLLGLLAILVAILVTPWRAELLLAGALGQAFAGTDAHADALLVGCAIALLDVRLPAAAGWAGLIGIVVAGALWSGGGGLVFMLPIATAGAFLAVAGCPQPIGWRPVAHVGRISYGLYLWHFLFIWWGLPWPIVFALSFLAAEASYVAIERPFLRMKDRFQVGTPPHAAAAADAPRTPVVAG